VLAPAGGRRERGELVEVRRLEVGDAIHQCAIGAMVMSSSRRRSTRP
jgi:hypothetical protein